VRQIKLAEREAAVVVLQAHWRGHRHRQRYLTMRSAAIVVQTKWRCYCLQKNFHQMKRAVLLIQNRWRYVALDSELITFELRSQKGFFDRFMLWSRMKATQEKALINASATTIQAWWRMFQARRAFLEKKRAAVAIQSFTRGCLARKQMLRSKSALVIQKWIRRFVLVPYAFASLTHNATVANFLNGVFHRYLSRKRLVEELCMRIRRKRQANTAALVIQTQWRGHRQRISYRRLVQSHAAATKVQAFLRMFVQRRAYLELKRATLAIQTIHRGLQARKFTQRLRSTLAIQRWYKRCARAMQCFFTNASA
jgi:abnormal spindle-like microcephaly-associated protein